MKKEVELVIYYVEFVIAIILFVFFLTSPNTNKFLSIPMGIVIISSFFQIYRLKTK